MGDKGIEQVVEILDTPARLSAGHVNHDINQVVEIPDTPDRLSVRRVSHSRVVEILDTPDRLSARQIGHGNLRGKERDVSVAGHLKISSSTNEECPKQLKNGTGLNTVDVHNGSKCIHPPLKNSIGIDECKQVNNNMSENLRSPQTSHLFRRKVLVKTSDDNEKLSTRADHVDNGKKLCFDVPHKSSSCAEDNGLSHFTLPNRHSQMLDTALSSSSSDNIGNNKRKGKEVNTGVSSLQGVPNSRLTSSKVYKGKEKVDDHSGKAYGAAIDHVKQIDHMNNSQPKHVKEISMPAPSGISVRVNGRKRLVRNGCISPHNIAIRARQVAECNSTNPDNVDTNGASNEFARSSSCSMNKTDIIVDDKNSTKINGRVATHHPSTARNHFGMPCRSVTGCTMDSHNMEQTDTVNEISTVECAISRDHAAQRVSRLMSNSNQISRPSHIASPPNKRQRRHGANNKFRGESSSSIAEHSEVLLTDSYRMSRNLRSPGLRSSRTQHSVIEIDDSSPVMRHINSESVGCAENDEAIARVRQMEADEMLARELQEQLYNEESMGLGDDVDEHIAWALQLEERATNTASRERRPVSRSRAPSMAHPHRPLSQPVRNSSSRRRSQPRAPSSSRMAQLRNSFRRQSPVLPRGGSFHDFRFDMTIDTLEALEAEFQQEFNDNDYETLLALDANNHHVGASGTQINRLPLSTVQNENFETCAICLESPSVGDTIRHLPCLHKFHKDCIDPWLSRKTSCPVCKSSIT